MLLNYTFLKVGRQMHPFSLIHFLLLLTSCLHLRQLSNQKLVIRICDNLLLSVRYEDQTKLNLTFNFDIIFFSASSDTLLFSSSRLAKCCL